MAEYLNVIDKIDSIEKGKSYDGDFVDSPLRLAYGIRKHPKDEKKYFLEIDWSYKHRHSETGEIYFSIETKAVYQIDAEKSKTTYDNIYSLILDSHSRLKTHYEKEVADTPFANFVMTEPDEDAFIDKVRQIVNEDLPNYQLP